MKQVENGANMYSENDFIYQARGGTRNLYWGDSNGDLYLSRKFREPAEIQCIDYWIKQLQMEQNVQ